MCFSSKRKPHPKTEKKIADAKQVPMPPQSTLAYSALHYKPVGHTNQAGYMLVEHQVDVESDILDRKSDYAVEQPEAQKSKLVENKDILKYDLDAPGGVSEVHAVKTFNYEKILNHCLLDEPQEVPKSAFQVMVRNPTDVYSVGSSGSGLTQDPMAQQKGGEKQDQRYQKVEIEYSQSNKDQ